MVLTSSFTWLLFCALTLSAAANPSSFEEDAGLERREKKIAPKVFIISMFRPESEIWHGIPEFNLLAQNITIPGLSPLFPEAFCTAKGDICQAVTGEAEINAAATISALVYSGKFTLTSTYWLLAGIAGISPEVGTLGSVTFARYAIQVALQYEFDARQITSNMTTGYVPQGSTSSNQYPAEIYGTEVFELNDALRQIAIGFAKQATLNDTAEAIAYRANYKSTERYAAAAAGPSVVACDVATSDTYFSGVLLSQAFENTTKLFTNGTGKYCTTAQEDNATLEVLVRAAAAKPALVDFKRIIIMRTASDFDREYVGEDPVFHLLHAEQGGFEVSITNIYVAGVKVVEGIINGWEKKFKGGVKANNYVGDIFGILGGNPDFGPGKISKKRGVRGRARRRAAAGLRR